MTLAATLVAPALLIVALVHVGAIVWRGRTWAGRWISRGRASERSRAMTAMALGLAVSFGVPALAGLALLGAGDAAWRFPSVLAAPGAAPSSGWPLVVGLAAGTLANAAMVAWRGAPREIGRFPDIKPQRRPELMAGMALSASAALSEELFFRALVPLLVVANGGSALLAYAVAAVAFGACHRYQGGAGMAVTTAIGAALGLACWTSGALWPALLCHFAIDVNALVVRPAAGGAWRRR